jgi:hypothetical protein
MSAVLKNVGGTNVTVWRCRVLKRWQSMKTSPSYTGFLQCLVSYPSAIHQVRTVFLPLGGHSSIQAIEPDASWSWAFSSLNYDKYIPVLYKLPSFRHLGIALKFIFWQWISRHFTSLISHLLSTSMDLQSSKCSRCCCSHFFKKTRNPENMYCYSFFLSFFFISST